ncbi:MAG: translation elongation factor G [Candidatus Solincola sediminis]|uniref:Elongation factor G n=1 Tax=Candidatus Solincola sediminis TaxID=1797199 RepID=A0A1F2WJH2_9ACTN|nr:MAG: translation elongation factor G [Candidatus Solincola sediminis]
MDKYEMGKIRNVALFGHGDSGKTSLAEAMLFVADLIKRMGRVDEGNTVSDFDPDEQKRGISVSSTPLAFEWQDYKMNLIDTPGFADFIGEVVGTLRVIDGAVFVVSAVAGLEVQTELIWKMADEYGYPRVVFVNKMDRENASFQRCLDEFQNVYGARVVPLQLPIGEEHDFKGVVDLIANKAYFYDNGATREGDIPPDMMGQVEAAREKVIEGAAEANDELMERYLEEEELGEQEVLDALLRGVSEGTIVPMLCGSATHNIGIDLLMKAIINSLPSPARREEIVGVKKGGNEEISLKAREDSSLCALVFNTISDPYVGKLTYFRVFSGVMSSDGTVYNPNRDKEERIGQVFMVRGKNQIPVREIAAGDIGGIAKLTETTTGDTLCAKDKQLVLPPIRFPDPIMSLAVAPKTKGDEDKLSVALARLSDEDPTFSVRRDTEVKQTIISGMGEAHLDIMMDRMSRKFGVNVDTELRKVPYKETIRKTAKAEGKHKKQTGGHGQFGIAWVEVDPVERGEGFEFVDKIVGGVIPRQFIPSVEKGVRKAMDEGFLAGYPMVDFKAVLYDGKYHPVDSSDISFQIAGSLALRNAVPEADPYLIEPIMEVEIMVPEAYMGDVIGDLNAKRGRILGMESDGGLQIVKAQVPMAEMLRYSIDLRSITGGRGTFSVQISHYEEVPSHIAAKIIEASKEKKE